jgi:hypothetical protein
MNEETMSDTSPSDHAWSQEHIAAYLAGGLDAQEAERLEAHARECVACAAALTAARHLDTGLMDLFAETRPTLGLEDRAIHKFRTTSHRPLLAGWARRATAAAAAIIILGALGAFANSLVEGGLPMPGVALRSPAERELAEREKLEAARTSEVMALDDTGSMEGTQAKVESAIKELETARGRTDTFEARVELVDKQTVPPNADGTYTGDVVSRPKSPATDSAAQVGDGVTNGLGFSSYGVWGEGGNTTASFPGRSGSTKTRLLREGGGNGETGETAAGRSVGGLGTGGSNGGNAPGAGAPGNSNLLGSYYANPFYQGVLSNGPNRGFGAGVVQSDGERAKGSQAPSFRPSDYAQKTVTVNEVVPVQKTITVMERVPVTKTVTVMERPAVPAGGTASPEQKEIPKAPDPKTDADNTQKPPAPPEVAPEPVKRVILRSGDVEFEIESFDAASATVTKLVNAIKGGFVSTINSDKLPNGKVKGSITVRVPPEQLDGLVLDLRKELGKGGTLKGVRISSQDVTKQYTDIESRLRGARTMEQRLLQIIKEGKGDIKILLEAEKELGVWRTKIEEFEGELRYYANLAALSTLTIILTEKEIRAAAALTESERVQAGVEVEDVDKTYQQVLAAVLEAKGRVTKSELKQVSAGQFNATLNFEIAPEASGPMRDRLNQLGRVARLEIDRVMQTEGGTLPTEAKAKRGDTVFLVQLYNLVAVAPRETATLQVAVVDVPVAYQAIRDAIAKANCRVLGAQLNEQDKQNVNAQLDFEVRRADEAAIKTALNTAGEVVAQQVTRAAEGENSTDAKVLYKMAILAANRLKPREVLALSVEVQDVDQTASTFTSMMSEAKGRQVDGNTSRDRNGHVTTKLIFEVPLSAAGSLTDRLKVAGVVRSFKSTRDPQATDGKYATARIEVTLSNQEDIVSVVNLSVEVANVDQTATVFTSIVKEAKGRQVDGNTSHERNGHMTTKLVYEVPLSAAGSVTERFKAAGVVRSLKSTRDVQDTEGKYATARIEVTLSNQEDIVAPNSSLWTQVRRGLSYSASVLLTSVTWVVCGLCVVLPFAIIGFAGYRVGRKLIGSPRHDTTLAASPPAPPAA